MMLSSFRLRCVSQRATECALRELDLEIVVAAADRARHCGIGGGLNVAIVRRLSASAASASGERHGLCATPPNATRAERIVAVAGSVATIAATETSANSYDARSRTLR